MQQIIKVEHLSKNFGKLQAVNNLSFTVNRGDVYGFLGQNGAGKSTTIRMLLTLITPTSGSIELFGKSLTLNRKEILQQIGAMIERPDLYKYLSAYDNLKIFAQLSGVDVTKDLLMKQLDVVGLAARANDKVKGFSQGMKQRLGIAIALVHNPQLVILDEPTNGLDPQGIADIRNLIKSLSVEQGKTVVVSSHLLNEIEQIATRILIVDKGKKVIEGTTQELLDPNQTIVEIETSNNQITHTILAESVFGKTLQPLLGNIALTLHKNQIPELNKYLVNQNIAVYSLQQRHSLEDYFLRITKGDYVHTV
ncbi:MAG: ABC transporter ATP-binding protein [Bacteroidetes bacterium]|nr:ABC transporter ATP-binding protein [Bacteroidota bacterium]